MKMIFSSILAARRRSVATLVFFALFSIAAHAQDLTISTAAGLKAFAEQVNAGDNFAGKTVKLAANITLNETGAGWSSLTDDVTGPFEAWTPIGTSTYMFNGTFDGNGYIIKGIYIPNGSANQGLFGVLGASGIIKNVGITASYIKGTDPVGALVGNNYGSVSNSFSFGGMAVVGSSGGDVGGMIGAHRGPINNCYAVGKVSTGSYTGGVVGYIYSSAPVSNSYYDVTVLERTTAGKGEAKTTAEMQNEIFVATLNNGAGKLTMNEWTFNSGDYPTLLHDKIAPDPLSTAFASGNGTEATPYIINTKAQLLNFSSLVNEGTNFQGKFLKLGQNINLAGAESDQWAVIGTSSTTAFQGTFDGDGKTISGVFIKNSSNYQGLFGYISSSSTIKNLGVSGSVEGGNYVGGLVGFNSGGTIRNSHSAGTVKGGSYVGGLVGAKQPGNIYDSYSTSNVEGTANEVGGLAGRNWNGGEIDNCYATGTVKGATQVGGLVGTNERPIKNSWATGAVSGTGHTIGGLAGYNASQPISNSYATGAVTGTDSIGGLIGRNFGTNNQINSSYAAGKVTGTSNVGGLVGLYVCNTCTISKSYYDRNTSDQNDEGKGEGKTTAEMQSQAIVAELNSIAGILGLKSWTYSSGKYPTLSTQNASFNTGAYFASGSGTSGSPYMINTRKQMEDFSFLVIMGKNFDGQYIKLGADIELNDNAKNIWQNWNATTAPVNVWTPIGTSASLQFQGTFDGNGKTVSGIYVSATTDYKGFFGYLGPNGTIKNLGVIASYIKGDWDVGGVVGYNNGGIVTNSYSTATVQGTYYTGGLVGRSWGGTVSNSYSTGKVLGASYSGGFIGIGTGSNAATTAVITNCYSTGTATGSGGTGAGVPGGFAGALSSASSATGSYFDSETSGLTRSVGTLNTGSTINGSTSPTTGSTLTISMKTKNTFIDWNFTNVWGIDLKINEGYPYLRGFTYATDPRSYEDICDSRGELYNAATGACIEATPEARQAKCLEENRIWETPANTCRDKIDWYDGKNSPYIISTASELERLAYLVNTGRDDFAGKEIQIEKNIALTGTWNPIGNETSKSFKGTFDGQEKTISGLLVNEVDYAGLFGNVGANGQIMNVRVTASEVKAGLYAGVLVGYYNSAKPIDNVYANGNATCAGGTPLCAAGGLAGGVYGTLNTVTISNSYATGNAHANTSGSTNIAYVGGLVGEAQANLIIENSWAGGKVSNTENSGNTSSIGGLVGKAQRNLTIEKSYARGKVSGYATKIGGLVGEADGSVSIKNSFSKGEAYGVNGMAIVGGLVGDANDGSVNIENSYVGGQIHMSSMPENSPTMIYGDVGGLVGFINTSRLNVNSAYYDNSYVIGAYYPVYMGTGDKEYNEAHLDFGKLTTSLKNKATFTDWDFTDIWAISSSKNNGYPYLLGMPEDPGLSSSPAVNPPVGPGPGVVVTPPSYSISVTSNAGGTARANAATATEGTTVSLSATPSEGYNFKEWNVKSGSVSISDKFSASATFKMPAEAVSIEAVFEMMDGFYKITVTSTTGGIANASANVAEYTTLVHLTATPSAGYMFKQWNVKSGEVVLSRATDANAKFTMPPRAVAIEAVFEDMNSVSPIIARLPNFNGSTKVEVFNLQGKPVSMHNLRPGVYIVKTGGEVFRIAIK